MGLGDSDPHLSPLVSEGDENAEGLLSGTRLGKYEILRRLSVGGMAEIFLARAAALPGFRKLVVIKRILPQLARQAEFLEMFLDEARIAATLQHPNIVQTYDVAVAGGNYFIAMEFLHGEDLHALLRTMKRLKQRIPIEHVVQIVISLCAGLHYAHERDDFEGKPLEIVHRDVTPANIIVTYEGSVKLLDFGIARAASRVNQTRSGTLKGKIHYMSPEQAQGKPIDRRTDVYAAGILLYELSLVRRLYKGETDYQILHNIVHGTLPKPSSIDANYDKDLEAIVVKALARDVDARYQTAQELQNDLEAFAKKRSLFLSPSSLKQYFAGLFGDRIDAWKQAEAQGKALPDAELVISYDDDKEPSKPMTLSAVPRAAVRRKPPMWLLAAGLACVAAVAAGATAWWPKSALPPKAPLVVTAPVVLPTAPAPPVEPPAPKAVAKELGSARIVTHPHGASLIVDGRRLSEPSNLLVKDLDAAEDHTVVAEKRGYQSAQRRFTVKAGAELRLSLDLSPAGRTVATTQAAPPPPAVAMKGEGILAITSSPWCAVDVDGGDRGQTPMRLTVGAGVHKVVLSNPEYKIKRQFTVTVHPGETVRKSLEFTR